MNRVVHPNGFSIVKPSDWHTSVEALAKATEEQGRDTSNVIVLSSGATRYSDFINVFFGRKAPGDPRSISMNSTFQGKPAYRRAEQIVAGVDHPYLALELVFERQGQLFEIAYIRWADPPPKDVPPEIWKYLETFRFDPPLSGKHTGAP